MKFIDAPENPFIILPFYHYYTIFLTVFSIQNRDGITRAAVDGNALLRLEQDSYKLEKNRAIIGTLNQFVVNLI